MSRVIKFRAWDDGKMIGPFELGSRLSECYCTAGDKIEQYTGLKDKNGKEIYEGDIVTGFEINGTYTNYTVKAIGGCFCYQQIGAESLIEISNYVAKELVEIVGNIHEAKS